MDSDTIQAIRQHTLMRYTKEKALREGKVRTNYVGKWVQKHGPLTVRVYKKHYEELGMTEYWLKHKRTIIGIVSEAYLFVNYTRVDKLRGKQ